MSDRQLPNENNINEVVSQMQQLSLPPFTLDSDFSTPFVVTQEILDSNMEIETSSKSDNHKSKRSRKGKPWKFKGPSDLKEAAEHLQRILFTRLCPYNTPCGICFDETKNKPVKVTPCGHVYHSRCLTPWTHDKYKRSCPTCRAELYPTHPTSNLEDDSYLIPLTPPPPGVDTRAEVLYWTQAQIDEMNRLQTEVANMQTSYNVLSEIDRASILIREQRSFTQEQLNDGVVRINHSYEIQPPLEQPEIVVDRIIESDHRITAVRVDGWHFDVTEWENTISIDGVMAWEDGLRDAYVAAARTLIRLEMERTNEILANIQPLTREELEEISTENNVDDSESDVNDMEDSFEEN